MTPLEKSKANGPILAQDTNGLWGYLDLEKGEWAIEPQYHEIFRSIDAEASSSAECGCFFEGLAPVKDSVNGKWGYIHITGEWAIEPQFTTVTVFKEGRAVVSNEEHLYGYINRKGENITPIIYDSASSFLNGMALVKSNDLYGYVNKQGKVVIEPQYKKASLFTHDRAYVERTNSDDGKTEALVIDKENNIIGQFSERLKSAGNGIHMPWYSGFMIISRYNEDQNEYHEIIDTDAKTVLSDLNQDFELCKISSTGIILASDRQTGLYGIIDKDANWIVSPQYSGGYNSDVPGFTESGTIAVRKDNQCFLIDDIGRTVFDFPDRPYDYLDIWTFRDGEIEVATKELPRKIGLVDYNGDIILNMEYENVAHVPTFKDTLYTVKLDGLTGLVDDTGAWIIEPKYNELVFY